LRTGFSSIFPLSSFGDWKMEIYGRLMAFISASK
jgi:hypothetical protein